MELVPGRPAIALRQAVGGVELLDRGQYAAAPDALGRRRIVVVKPLIEWARDAEREKRAEAKELTREQNEVAGDRRVLCVNLLSLARHFRVLVENAYDSCGPVLDSNVEQVRGSVADIASQADKMEFNVPKARAAAVSLADEARKLALTAEENREHGSSLVSGDFTKFDDCLEAFKDSARSAFEEFQERAG